MLSLLLFFNFIDAKSKKEQAGGESGRGKEQAKSKIDKMKKILGRQR